MANFTVTTLNDVVDAGDGGLSLREAVNRSNATDAADSIDFRAALEGGEVVLRGSQLTLRDDVRIDGDRNEDGTGITIDADDRSRVLEVSGSDDFSATSLDGLTITGGLSGGDGGGILVRGSNRLEITDSRITGNEGFRYAASYGDGGGIFADRGSSLSLVRSTVGGNNGTNGGGIFAADDSFVSLRRSTVEGNTGSAYRDGDGGGLFLDGAYARITDSTISGNLADGNGAGISSTNSFVTIVDSTISGNAGEYRLGGGAGGGIFARDGSDISLQSVTVTGNRSGFDASYGSAGGGIFVDFESPGYAASTLSVSDSIVAGNFNGEFGAPDAVAEDIEGRITESNGSNIFGTAVTGNEAGDLEGVAASRLFAAIDPDNGGGRLALNGGPTETVRLRDSADNLALNRAFDADDFDQRGFARPRPDGTGADAGAFELNQRPAAAVASALNEDAARLDFSAGREEARPPEHHAVTADDHEAARLAQADQDFYF